ncbi:hypothetical protein U1Q18_027703 [Sarracenia purpurea var. burkii]
MLTTISPEAALSLHAPLPPKRGFIFRGTDHRMQGVMGSERKFKDEEKREKKRISDYGSEDEGKSKRHRSVKDEEAKISKSEKKDKTKRKKKSHTSSKQNQSTSYGLNLPFTVG